MLFLLTRIYELQGRCSRRETFNTIYVHHIFYGASAPRRTLARERPFCHFLGEVLRKMAKRDATESSAAPRRRPKRHTWQWNGSLHTKRLSTVSSLYVVHAHTQYAYNNMYASLLYRTPNTQHPKKEREKKERENMCYTPFYQPCARARTKPEFAHARVCAHTGSTRRRVRFLRRVVARGDMGRFAFTRAQSSSSSSDAFHDHRREK